MAKYTAFQKWFTTFLEEKCVDMAEYMGHHEVQVGDVCTKIMNTTKEEQAQIKDVLVKIDFHNGDVNHFFKHLAKSITSEELENIRDFI